MRNQIETNNCVALMSRLAQYHPEIFAAIYHCPNESQTRTRTDIGIKPGQPDYCLPIPRNGYGSLYIEMKKPKGRISPSQLERIPILSEYNKVVVCYSWQEAMKEIENYMSCPTLLSK